MLLSTISAPLRPSRTRRVGATSKSPMPASAGAAAVNTDAASKAAVTTGLVLLFIMVIPKLLRTGAITVRFDREWLIFGQPRRANARFAPRTGPLVVDRDVERAGIEPAGCRGAERDRPAEREDRALVAGVRESHRGRTVDHQCQRPGWIVLVGQRDVGRGDPDSLVVRPAHGIAGNLGRAAAGQVGIGAGELTGARDAHRCASPGAGPERNRS